MVSFHTTLEATHAFRAVIALVVSCVFLAFSPSSYAECSGVDEKGGCVDLTTVQWCDNGELKTASCPDGEICALVKDTDNRYTCIAKSYTDCADIPDEGLCTSGNNAAWCVDGSVMIKECRKDEVCELIEGGWVDCVVADSVPSLNDDASSSDDAGVDDAGRVNSDLSSDAGPEPEHGGEAGHGPTPPVSPGDPYVVDTTTMEAGCVVGATSSLPRALVPLFILGLVLMRRRYHGQIEQD